MGLIINKTIPMLKKGYPTVSDKYNVAGGILGGSNPVGFGDLVKKGSTAGYFDKAASISDVSDICGFVVATNVKLTENWPGTVVQVNPGEAFNLLIGGFIAIELDSGATAAYVTANAQVAVILATGKLTTADKIDSSTIVGLPNCVFTGISETQGSAKLAEIYVK